MKAHFSTATRLLVNFAGASSLSLVLSGPAQAVDGCKLLLCMAGNWQHISQCTGTVREALRDLLRGRVWPTCGMGGSSASGNQYVTAEQCPEQYIVAAGPDEVGRIVYSCPFGGVIHVAIDGQPWSRTWWSPTGDSVVEWLPAAKAAYANSPDVMDGRFDRDLAAWRLREQDRPAPPAGGGTGTPGGGG